MDKQADFPAAEIRTLLLDVYPVQCEKVGEDTLDDICHHFIDFESGKGGRSIELSGTIALLTAAANLILALIKLREELQKMHNSGASGYDLEAKKTSELAAIEHSARDDLKPGKIKELIQKLFSK